MFSGFALFLIFLGAQKRYSLGEMLYSEDSVFHSECMLTAFLFGCCGDDRAGKKISARAMLEYRFERIYGVTWVCGMVLELKFAGTRNGFR